MAPQADHMRQMASGLVHLVVSQVATRLVTFSMNLLVARHLSPEAYGLSSVQFHLLTTTILLLSREGFRRGCMRVQDKSKASHAVSASERVLAVSWLVLPVGIFVTSAVTAIVLSQHAAQNDPTYSRAVYLHDSASSDMSLSQYMVLRRPTGIACLVELCSEPLYIIASTQLKFTLRVGIETAAMVSKCALVLLLVLRTSIAPALVFSAAQLLFAGITLVGYLGYGARLLASGQLKLHYRRWDASDWDTLWMSGLFSLQAAEKLVLAEGSKLAMVAVESAYNQGVYGLVSNLGSLVVRTLFQPFEEVAFVAFSRAGIAAKSDVSKRARLAGVLGVLVRGVTILGLLAVAFGPWYSYTLLRLVYSQRWSETEAPFVLGCYTVYILLLAVNGITEAFVHAVLDAAALKQANAMLIVFTGAHMCLSLVMVRAAGAVGLVGADAITMLLRISYSLWFISRYFSGLPGKPAAARLFPNPGTLAAFAAASAVAAASCIWVQGGMQGPGAGTDDFWQRGAVHVGVGAACLAVLLAQLARTERDTFRQLLQLRQQRHREGPGGHGGTVSKED